MDLIASLFMRRFHLRDQQFSLLKVLWAKFLELTHLLGLITLKNGNRIRELLYFLYQKKQFASIKRLEFIVW